MLRYLPGLDGMRALAVLAVLAYHSSLGIAPGGFLGVEIFFVISGFIITHGLLAERKASGRIALRRFWARRARRLLPALFLLLVSVLAYEEVFEPDEVTALRSDILAALGYVTNWYLLARDSSYFDTFARPPLLRHLWSLAIEEQFYVVWPLLFTVLLAALRPARATAVIAAGAVASSLAMAILWHPGGDPSRVYYGTDTRAAGLLAGAALACVLERRPLPAAGSGRKGLVVDLVGGATLVALVAIVFTVDESDPSLFRGGFAVVDVLTAVLIAAAIRPGGVVAEGLGWRPLRWVGLRSYGIYLWHWPLFTLTHPGTDVALRGVPLVALQAAATFAIAAVSYRWLERPIREGALTRAGSRLAAWSTLTRSQRAALATPCLAAVTLFSLLAFQAVVAKSPERPAYFELERIRLTSSPARVGRELKPIGLRCCEPGTWATVVMPALRRDAEGDTADARGGTLAAPGIFAPGRASGTAGPDAPADDGSRPTLSSTSVSSMTAKPAGPDPPAVLHTDLAPWVTAIGDSVMLGAASQFVNTVPDIDVDAAVSRAMIAAVGLIRQRSADGTLGQVVLIHLGNNGPIDDGQVDAIFDAVGPGRRVVFVNLKAPLSWEEENNGVLARGVARHSNAFLVDWHAASKERPDAFWSDGIHLRPEGAAFYVSLIRPYLGSP